MHPLVRWQFRGGIAEKDRKAFLFTNVIDAKGRKYDIPVAVGVLAANREIYRIGMGCALDEIDETWNRAVGEADRAAHRRQRAVPGDRHRRQGARPTGQRARRPAGADLDAGLGRRALHDAVAIHHQGSRHRHPEHGHLSRPGEGAAPARHEPVARIAAGHLRRIGRRPAPRGEKLPAAVVLGAPPCVAYTSAQKLPETMDELYVAGGLVGAPINVVKAKTVDLLVPAEAEIVIEGLIETDYLEPEAPFGESHGHVNLQEYNAFMEVTASRGGATRSSPRSSRR